MKAPHPLPREVGAPDLPLLSLLRANPRAPFGEIANTLGTRARAVEQRVVALRKAGVLEGFTADLDPAFFASRVTHLLLRGDHPELAAAIPRLLRVEGVLRVHEEMGGLFVTLAHDGRQRRARAVAKARSVARPLEVEAVLDGADPALPGRRDRPRYRVRPVDARLVAALRRDARVEISALAQEAGVSARTAQRHLDALLDAGAVRLGALVRLDRLQGVALARVVVFLADGASASGAGAAVAGALRGIAWDVAPIEEPPALVLLLVRDTASELRDDVTRILSAPGAVRASVRAPVREWVSRAWEDACLARAVEGDDGRRGRR